jgi:hypothetical protein
MSGKHKVITIIEMNKFNSSMNRKIVMKYNKLQRSVKQSLHKFLILQK